MTPPLYHVIYHELKQRILSATYPPGASLPSERKLSEEFAVSLITIRRALDELTLDGLIERRQGKGTFVRDRARNVIVDMPRFTADVVAGRLRVVRTLLQDEIAPASRDVAARLNVQEGSALRHLVRLDSEGGSALSIDEVFMPPALAAPITAEVAASPSFLFLCQDKTGLVLTRAEFEVSVQPPTKTNQDLLQIGPDALLLVTGELFFGDDEKPALWVITRYRSERTRLYGSYMVARNTAL